MAIYRPQETSADQNARLQAEAEERIAQMRASGYTGSGNRIVSWSDKFTPVTVGKTGLTGGTPQMSQENWSAQFQRRDSQPAMVPNNSVAARSPSPVASVVPVLPSNPFGGGQISLSSPNLQGMWSNAFKTPAASSSNPLPSLSVLASSGGNHATKWMSPIDSAGAGMVAVSKYIDPAKPLSTAYDNTPGTRRPFIAGRDGRNVAGAIADRLGETNPSSTNYDRTLDRNRFSWSATFAR